MPSYFTRIHTYSYSYPPRYFRSRRPGMGSGLLLLLGGAFVGYHYAKHHESGTGPNRQRAPWCRRDVVTSQDVNARLDAFKREMEGDRNGNIPSEKQKAREPVRPPSSLPPCFWLLDRLLTSPKVEVQTPATESASGWPDFLGFGSSQRRPGSPSQMARDFDAWKQHASESVRLPWFRGFTPSPVCLPCVLIPQHDDQFRCLT